jgi:hypothetical protein
MAALLAAQHLLAGQSGSDEAGRFFGLTNLWTIRLTLPAESWMAMEPAGAGRPEVIRRDYPWRECTFECAGQVLSNLAIRYKGNSSFNASRGGLKRPLKLDFNRGHKGRAFFGLKKLSLNNNFNDATQLREVLAYEAYRETGLPTPRTAFARVYLTLTGRLTNQCLGLYTLVEAVDEDFLKAHFETKKGLLLKPERLRTLEYLGENWQAYTNRYDPKTTVQAADAQRFIALTRLIARANDTELERELPARLDLDRFLRYVAVTAVLANYDSFVGNGHNYYFFQPSGEAKATFIPWDLNEAFGGHPMVGSRAVQAELSVLRPQAGPNRLIEQVLANPTWAAAYRREVAAALSSACSPARLRANAERIARSIEETVMAESPTAQALFKRVALGQTQLPAPPPEGLPGERGLGPGFGPGAGFGPLPGPGPEMPLADWIELRARNVADELSGKRTASIAQLRNFPAGPGGQAGPPGGGPGRPGGPRDRMRNDPLAEDLFPPELVMVNQEAIGLTAEQRTTIENALEEARLHLQEGERAVREEVEKLRSMINADRPDEPKVLAQSDKLLDLEKALRRAHLGLLIRIKTCLTPEQQAKLRELK